MPSCRSRCQLPTITLLRLSQSGQPQCLPSAQPTIVAGQSSGTTNNALVNRNNSNASATGNANKCYNYGEPRHYTNRCPKKAGQGQQGVAWGKLNHVIVESAQKTPYVVTGCGDWYIFSQLPPCLSPFLFLSLNSFISYDFIKKHHRTVCVMKSPMLVKSSGREMKANWACLAASIIIRRQSSSLIS